MLEHLNLLERETQNDVIRLLQDELGYRFIGNLDEDMQQFDAMNRVMPGKYRKMHNTNIRVNDLTAFLQRQGWTYAQAEQAYNTLRATASACHRYNEIYTANENVYNMLTSFTTVRASKDKPLDKTLQFILWDKPEENDFAFAEEVSVLRDGASNDTRRPDIVIYINGIAVAVLELKRAAVSVAEGIRQSFRKSFFVFNYQNPHNKPSSLFHTCILRPAAVSSSLLIISRSRIIKCTLCRLSLSMCDK